MTDATNTDDDFVTITGNSEILTKLSPNIFKAYKQLALQRNIVSYDFNARPVSGVGENSYGYILKVCLKATQRGNKNKQESKENDEPKTFMNILKISPKNSDFRAHSRIVDLYNREVFMYDQVLKEYFNLEDEKISELRKLEKDKPKTCDNLYAIEKNRFNVVPEMFYASLELQDEFLILEDLSLSDYKQNLRTNMPTYDLVCAAFRSIAKFHAMSFILQKQKPELFEMFVEQIDDNLFVENMEPITVEFGKKYIRRTRLMMEQDVKKPSKKQMEALIKLEENYKEICLKCVDGKAMKPYAVICHGDFWNNNILYKKDDEMGATHAKLIDFQLSRYACPVLDLVNYLFACTERSLRNKHFMEFMDIYHDSLAQHVQFYGYHIEVIYPKIVFQHHIKKLGIFGFAMAALSIPFFISNTSELPDFDQVAGIIRSISSTDTSDEENGKNHSELAVEAVQKRLEVLEEYDLLSERNLPIFRKRMYGIVRDLEKYEMLDSI